MILVAKQIKKSYQQGNRSIDVLKGINLEVDRAQKVAITGKSGSGKTTLLSVLSGLEDCDSGEVYFDKKDLNSLTVKELSQLRSKEIGIVFQQFHLVSHLSALENIQLPLLANRKNHGEKQVREILEKVGLGSRGEHYPHQLSGGECQRVAIARAMITEPKLIFADEPSGNLDEETGEQIIDLFFSLVEETKTSIVFVTHDKELANKCDKVIHLEHGVVASVS